MPILCTITFTWFFNQLCVLFFSKLLVLIKIGVVRFFAMNVPKNTKRTALSARVFFYFAWGQMYVRAHFPITFSLLKHMPCYCSLLGECTSILMHSHLQCSEFQLLNKRPLIFLCQLVICNLLPLPASLLLGRLFFSTNFDKHTYKHTCRSQICVRNIHGEHGLVIFMKINALSILSSVFVYIFDRFSV